MKKNKALFLDIMLNDRFVCTLKYHVLSIVRDKIREFNTVRSG